jgi:NAD(P)H dehydrogenase (quinone)
MRVFIVLAHPRPDSFNAAVCAALCDGLQAMGHQIDMADLCAERFDPVLQGAELSPVGHTRVPRDVARYQRRIRRADALAFVFPVWWFGPPAILKGFVDRVLREGFAFRIESTGRVRGLLAHEKALVISTTGARVELYRRFQFGRPLEKTLGEWTLKMCGVRSVRHVLLHDVVNVDAASRERYLKKVRRLGREYF